VAGESQGADIELTAVGLVRRHRWYQLIMYSCVRMKLDGLDDVPWYSPWKRRSAEGTPRVLSAA
jgi:hypothetical protein